MATEPRLTGMEELTSLFERASAEVYGFLLLRADSRELAEEILAQTFEAAARQLDAVPDEPLGVGWLMTVAKRRLIDHWRRSEASRRAASALRTDLVSSHLAIDAADSAQPDREQRQNVEASLAALSPRQRAALTMRYLDDMAVSEVADVLDLSYQATESLLARARRSFRQSYSARVERTAE